LEFKGGARPKPVRIAFLVEESKHAGLALDSVFADFYGRWYLELVLKAI